MDDLEKKLHKYFGFDFFRPGQKEIIEDVLNGNHVLATLPTGSGKSICYQLPALMMNGTVIVVTPLLSLMEDQVKQLKRRGIKQAVAINSFNTAYERQLILNDLARFKLIYLSPEMLQNKDMLTKLKRLTISLVVIDEAHCISQWGHEFRPDYLKLDLAISEFNHPTVLALTATATPDVQNDIVNHFEAIQFTKHLYPIDRDNIDFIVKHVDHRNEKDDYLLTLFETYTVPTIIYFSSKKEAERVSRLLSETFQTLNVTYYHSDLVAHERILIQEQFIENQIEIICSTSAFGMGVDKQNIRLIIHYHLPTQLESFIQEIGRAGRDQLSSVSITLIAPGDEQLPQYLIKNELPSRQLIESILADFEQMLNNRDRSVIDPTTINTRWQLNETQWRFIKRFFEQLGIINDKNQLYIERIHPGITQDLLNKVEERNYHKQGKLNEFINWLSTQNCRREHLFKPFQVSVRKARFHCCDRCGFQLEQWEPEQIIRERQIDSWSDQLKSILLPFERGEIKNESTN